MAWPWDSAAGGGFRCEVADNKARLVVPCLVSSRSFLRRLGLANMDLSRQLREQAIQGAGYVTGAGDLCLYMCISCAILRECPSAHRNFLAFDSLRYHGYTSARSPPRPAPPRFAAETRLVAQDDFRNHFRYSKLAVLPVSCGLLVVHSPIAALPLHAHKTSRDRYQEQDRHSSRCRHRRPPSLPLHWQCSPRTARCPWPCPSCTY